MISIIISTYQPVFLEALRNNIEQTIGVTYEIIAIENKGEKSICEVYNIGVQKAQYVHLCFVHEDILFHTHSWGQNVLNHFKVKGVDVLAIAGSTYFSLMPGGWWSSLLTYQNLLQSTKENNKPILESRGNNDLKRKQILAFDGAFFCAKKEIFHALSFDDKTFKGFHFYDADFSMQLHEKQYKVYCIYDVLIQHFSLGNLDKNWIDNALIFQKKWGKILPATILSISEKKNWDIEFGILYEFMETLRKNKFSKKKINWIAYQQISKFKYFLFNYRFFKAKLRFLIESIS